MPGARSALSVSDGSKDLPESVKPVAAVLFTSQGVFNPVQYCAALAGQFRQDSRLRAA